MAASMVRRSHKVNAPGRRSPSGAVSHRTVRPRGYPADALPCTVTAFGAPSAREGGRSRRVGEDAMSQPPPRDQAQPSDQGQPSDRGQPSTRASRRRGPLETSHPGRPGTSRPHGRPGSRIRASRLRGRPGDRARASRQRGLRVTSRRPGPHQASRRHRPGRAAARARVSRPSWTPGGQPPYPGPGYRYGYGPRPPRFRRRHPFRGAIIALVLFIIFGFVVRNITRATTPSRSRRSPRPAAPGPPGARRHRARPVPTSTLRTAAGTSTG